MNNRQYYSARTGRNPNTRFDLPMLRRLFLSLYQEFDERFYFQEAFGYCCVDEGDVSGKAGSDIPAFFVRKLRKEGLWPIAEMIEVYSEDDLFDVIEFLYDLISKPLDGRFHNYANCGWHFHTFDQPAGRQEYRQEVNSILCDYSEGFAVNENGEIIVIGPVGLISLLDAEIPHSDDANVRNRIAAAVEQFRYSRASADQRRDAVRNLGDVFEFLRPQVKNILREDENDLFNILNNFGIRHHNERQRTDYEGRIFLSWLFYHYLAGIHALLWLIENRESDTE